MAENKKPFQPFPTADEDLINAEQLPKTKQTASSSFKLAFADQDFLLREELRPVRLQLELLKPELIQQEHNIHSTIVVFGSARILEPSVSKKLWEETKHQAKMHPEDARLQKQAKISQALYQKSHYYDMAREFTSLVSSLQQDKKCDYVIITGGGPGIMEAANRGVHDNHAKSISLNVVLPHEQMPNPYVTPELNFQFHYFAIRKMHFLIRARALVAFPGGFGTLDEVFEALTLLQTRKIDPVPVILFGQEYWEKIINFEAMVDEGVILEQDLRLFQYAQTPQEAWDIILDFYKEKK